MSGPERAALRRLIDRATRRQLGAELDERGRTDLPGAAHGHKALACVAWDAAGGDPLLALTLAVDNVRAKAADASCDVATARDVIAGRAIA